MDLGGLRDGRGSSGMSWTGRALLKDQGPADATG
jgi:hypothetical protein